MPSLIETKNYIISEPARPRACIIWLHGLGASGHDLAEGVWPYMPDDIKNQYRAIFPHASSSPVTINGGISMPAWYDIFSLENVDREDGVGLEKSVVIINDLIQEQSQDDRVANNIVIAGFSQGGGVAIHAGLNCTKKLAAIMLCSSYVPLQDELLKAKNRLNYQTPIFFMHGRDDLVVPCELMQRGYDFLRANGLKVSLEMYNHGHVLSEPQLKEIAHKLSL
ncbi:MAG: carboxylesterase [Legionellales bacterium]|jgi:phospholipase/carboxylesterase|nr:carboxylesterase [Legionellales bacterium]